MMAIHFPCSYQDVTIHIKSPNFSYSFPDADYTKEWRSRELFQDYERIQHVAERFEIILMSHTCSEWHEEIAILARKADEWLAEFEKLEACMFQAWKCIENKRYGFQYRWVTAGGFYSLLTGNLNVSAADEDGCTWFIESPDGTVF
ncbi:MAG: hypothetical protein Q9208_002753 [Pyrenodesmia sp. 3 TL-2023]